MKAVLYVTRMVPHYRRAALEQLNARLHGRLVVCAGAPPKSSSLSTLLDMQTRSYETIAMRNFWVAGQKLHAQPFGHVFARYPKPSVIIAEESVRSLTLPLLLLRGRRAGAARLLWGHFSSNWRPFSERSPLTAYRLALARSVEGCICYSQPVADRLQRYVERSRLFVAPNTLDTGALLALYEDLAVEGREAVRRRLGLLPDAPVIAFLGRLIRRKGTDRLLEAFELISEKHPRATLLVIGDGPERPAIEARMAKMHGIRLLGALTRWRSSAPYLFASDVLLNPGYLGLSINHAFALGLPVVSQQSPNPRIRYHSPEITYLEHGKNGLLSPYGDVAALVAAVEEVIVHRRRFSAHALAYARAHLGLHMMVDEIVRAVHSVESGGS